MDKNINVSIASEIGELEGVIIHTPGLEVEEMTPENAKRALYSDILNLSVARHEYNQFRGILQKVCQCFEVTELLSCILNDLQVKRNLLEEICRQEKVGDIFGDIDSLDTAELSRRLIQGVPIERNNLTRYLSNERFSLWPLHNCLFTRDASMAFGNEVFIGKMANEVRSRETIIMDYIFRHHPLVSATTVNPRKQGSYVSIAATLEGGDFLAVAENIIVAGTGIRTSTQGIDFIVDHVKSKKEKVCHILVQELPDKPESFIHLDMVFTILDRDTCMVYEPLILSNSRFRTIHIRVDNGRVTKISEETNLLQGLKKLGMDLMPVCCGGTADPWIQEREQWHSGANFFALAPGQVIGYERNANTLDELNKNGFDVLKANDIIDGTAHIPATGKCVITIAGAELARGGGGARCMTMPFKRKPV